MNRTDYYQNNLLIRHKQTMLLGIGGLILLAFTVVSSIIWSFGVYRRATQNTYVFHPKGADISIYDERTNTLSLPLTPSRQKR
ncbi:MAG: hypothetical protein LH609_13450 [Rudanella sp.]|nr:hypothetical protein [Rudanella sp.]